MTRSRAAIVAVPSTATREKSAGFGLITARSHDDLTRGIGGDGGLGFLGLNAGKRSRARDQRGWESGDS